MTVYPTQPNPIKTLDLYAAGYRCYVADGSLLVRRQDGTRYLVDLFAVTCTCPARTVCKHLRGIADLVHDSENNLWNRGKRGHAVALAAFWADYQFAMMGGA